MGRGEKEREAEKKREGGVVRSPLVARIQTMFAVVVALVLVCGIINKN